MFLLEDDFPSLPSLLSLSGMKVCSRVWPFNAVLFREKTPPFDFSIEPNLLFPPYRLQIWIYFQFKVISYHLQDLNLSPQLKKPHMRFGQEAEGETKAEAEGKLSD